MFQSKGSGLVANNRVVVLEADFIDDEKIDK